jgi:predicted permease
MTGRDLKQALRLLGQRRAFSLVVVLTLALGIGTTTALFSIANALFFRRMPYPEPDRLAVVQIVHPTGDRGTASFLEVQDWMRDATSFEGMAAFAGGWDVNLTGGDEPERARANLVSASYFEVLGVQPVLGRAFLPEEDRVPGSHPVVLLSHDLWLRRFGSDPEIIGRTLSVDDLPYTVVGVLPPGFQDLAFAEDVDLWIPLMMTGQVIQPFYLEQRIARWLTVVGRLRPGASLDEARATMAGVARRLEEDFPDQNRGYGIDVNSLEDYFFGFGRLRRSILILALGAFFVLLIACVNVSNLFLVHGLSRQREIAVRLAMGAGRARVIRQFITEALVLSLLGGALGIVLAQLVTKALVRLSPLPLPGYVRIGVDLRVLAATVVIALAAGLAFGTVPALRASQVRISDVFRDARGSFGRRQRLAGDLLVTAEVALALVLLIGAGLMIRSFQEFHGTRVGFDTRDLAVVQLQLSRVRYADDASRLRFFRTLTERTRALDGVEDAFLWGTGLPGRNPLFRELIPEGRDANRPEDRVRAFDHRVTPGAIRALGIPLLRGRDFTADDDEDSPRVAVVSESLAKAAWPGQDALGKRFRRGGPIEDDPWLTVVGVAADALHRGRQPDGADRKDYYMPLLQKTTDQVGVLVRTRRPPSSVLPELRRAVHGIDSELPVFNATTMEELLAEDENETLFYALLTGVFAGIAIFLAVLGIYSVLSYAVSQRKREFGIRLALGAQRASLYRLVGMNAFAVLAGGIVLGLLAAFSMTRLLSGMIFGISTTDVLTFIGVPLLLGIAGAAASYGPIRRATRVDTTTVLKEG